MALAVRVFCCLKREGFSRQPTGAELRGGGDAQLAQVGGQDFPVNHTNVHSSVAETTLCHFPIPEQKSRLIIDGVVDSATLLTSQYSSR
jgi:hypothetical protein